MYLELVAENVALRWKLTVETEETLLILREGLYYDSRNVSDGFSGDL